MYEKGFKHCFYKIVQRQDTFVLKIVARNREMTLALQLFCEHKRSSGIVLLYVHLYSSIRRPSTYRTTVKPHIPSKTSRPTTITSPPYYQDAPIVRHLRTYRSDRSGMNTSHMLTLDTAWYTTPPGPTLIWRVPQIHIIHPGLSMHTYSKPPSLTRLILPILPCQRAYSLSHSHTHRPSPLPPPTAPPPTPTPHHT